MSISITSLTSPVSPLGDTGVFLSTVKITSPSLVEMASRTATCWAQMVVRKQEEVFERSISSDTSIRHRLVALKSVSDGIARYIPKIASGRFNALYAVVDSAKKIQGLALAILSADEKSRLCFLATHPDNVPLPGSEAYRIRGVGTALIRHFAHDVLVSANPTKTITLLATDSAVPFYERLGFVMPSIFVMNMQLEEEGIRKLVQQGVVASMLPDDSSLLACAAQLH